MQSFKKALEDAKREYKITQKPELFKLLEGKPFWIWDKDKHKVGYGNTKGKCCFNHIVSLPEKDRKKHALYPYEHEICIVSIRA